MPEGKRQDGGHAHITQRGGRLREAQAGQMVKEASLSPSSVPTRVSLEARPPGSQGCRVVWVAFWQTADGQAERWCQERGL